MARRANGEGSVYRRKDGRWEAAGFFTTTSGQRKRIRKLGKTRQEAHDKLVEVQAHTQQGVPIPDKTWKLGDYLDYWLQGIIEPSQRPSTYERYELVVRLYLKTGLGKYPLSRLSVPAVQTFLNQQLAAGRSIRNVHIMREVLSSALTSALREELIGRNVARLVKLPSYRAKKIVPWTMEETKSFLELARTDPLYPAFVLMNVYGLRRGEVLGLRWRDVDFARSKLSIFQQIQRVRGELRRGPVKTEAGQRDLPLLNVVSEILTRHQKEQLSNSTANQGGDNGDELVFCTRHGTPIEPRNLVRSFQRICEQHGLRVIRIHDQRHTAITLLKDIGVADRDIQLIAGHSDISVTQQIYQHGNAGIQRSGLENVARRLFWRAVDGARYRQLLPSALNFFTQFTTFQSGRGDRTRTCDTRFWSSLDTGVLDRATEVNSVVNMRRQQWIVGLVAVSVAVKTDPTEEHKTGLAQQGS